MIANRECPKARWYKMRGHDAGRETVESTVDKISVGSPEKVVHILSKFRSGLRWTVIRHTSKVRGTVRAWDVCTEC